MRRWRDWQCRHADLIVTPSAQDHPRRCASVENSSDRVGRRHGALSSRRPGQIPFTRNEGDVVAVFSGAFRAWHGAISSGRCHPAAASARPARHQGRVHRRRPGAAARARRRRRRSTALHSSEPCRTTDVPAILAAADIGVAPFDVAAHPSLAHEFHWSPLKIFEYMASGLPVVAPRIERLAGIVRRRARRAALRRGNPDATGGRARASRAIQLVRRTLGAAARDARRRRIQLGEPLPRARHSDTGCPPASRMRILIATDAFPPVSGGSGWSTYELAKGLRARGHHVVVVRTYSERDAVPSEYDGFAVVGISRVRAAGAVCSQLRPQRTVVRAARLVSRQMSSQRERDRSHPRTTRADRPRVGDSGTARRHPVGVHRPRLLACVLLGRCAGGPWRRRSLPRLFRFSDDAVPASAHRSGMAGGAAGDSVYAGESPPQTSQPRRR